MANTPADVTADGREIRVGATASAELHNLTSGAGVVYDIYPKFHDLIDACPIEHGTVHQHFDNPHGWNYEAFFPSDDDVVVAHGYNQVQQVFRRSGELSSQALTRPDAPKMPGAIISMDEPEHRRLRVLLQPAFSRLAMERWKTDIIQPIVDQYLERIRPWGRADLYYEIAPNVPIQTISVALGLPAEDQRQFFEWAVGMTSGRGDMMANALALYEYIAPLVAERREEPGDDLLSVLTQARIEAGDAADVADTRPLTDEEINGFVGLLIIAGAGTTYKAYGSLMFMLLTHPDVLDAVREDRALVPQAIEESLRIESPIAIIRRRAAVDLDVDGVDISEGCPVIVNIAAANHDHREWGDHADEYDIHRDRPDRHMTFGFGIHRCLGIHLARAELHVLCNRTLDLLPNVRLDQDEPAPRMTGLGMRLPTALPVVWDNT
jgi:cytochrome P450